MVLKRQSMVGRSGERTQLELSHEGGSFTPSSPISCGKGDQWLEHCASSVAGLRMKLCGVGASGENVPFTHNPISLRIRAVKLSYEVGCSDEKDNK